MKKSLSPPNQTKGLLLFAYKREERGSRVGSCVHSNHFLVSPPLVTQVHNTLWLCFSQSQPRAPSFGICEILDRTSSREDLCRSIENFKQQSAGLWPACFLLLAPGFVRSLDRACDRSEMDGSGGHQLPLEWPHPGPYGYDPYTNSFLPLPYYGYGFGVEYSWNPPDQQQGPIPAPYFSSSVPLGASFF